MNINDRVRLLRNQLNMTQTDFGSKISVTQNHLSGVEIGRRDVSERMIKIICLEFNVNEEWLRHGDGEIFVQTDTFSLDDYANKNNLSNLEIDIIKSYMELDSDIRKTLMNNLKMIFNKNNEVSATIVDNEEDDINAELEKYRLELEAEKKVRTLSVSEERETS